MAQDKNDLDSEDSPGVSRIELDWEEDNDLKGLFDFDATGGDGLSTDFDATGGDGLSTDFDAETDSELARLSGASGGHEPEFESIDRKRLDQEAMRQEMRDVEKTHAERAKGIKVLEEAQEILEDKLEDANREIDRLRRELDKLSLEVEESRYQKQEADDARKQLEGTLYKIQEGVEDSKVTDLRDSRLQRSRRPLAISGVMRGPQFKALLLGAGGATLLWLSIFEILSLGTGHGELFGLLFGSP
jgi:hypothetical protein